jgi:two-component system OmpR family sensor kinase
MTLLAKIRTIFVIASVVIGLLFWVAFRIQITHFEQTLMDRFMQVAPYCHRQPTRTHSKVTEGMFQPTTPKLIQTGGFKEIAPPSDLTQSTPHYVHRMPMGTATIHRLGGIYYLHFHTTQADQWLQNTVPSPSPSVMLAWYGTAMGALWLLYLWLARSLRPLKELHQAIVRIKHGDLSISTRNPHRDEIAQVANTLDDALRKIEALIHSRQLFLHAIMHELKTPIAKGKLLNAFLEEGEEKERYEALFERLDLLLGEFAKIEQMLTANYTLRISSYSAEDLIEHALELMLLEPDEIANALSQTIDPHATIKTDFNLFTLALKNLIDNALTHSSDHRAMLTASDGKLTIQNWGEALARPLEAYREPFGASSGGLGLGLYIVLSIVDVLGISLSYRHQDKLNTFTLTFDCDPNE